MGLFTKKLTQEETNSIIDLIHNEFNTASDLLLKRANTELESILVEDINKVNRLKSYGFNNTIDVIKGTPILDKQKLLKSQLEMIQRYFISYPNNKFITQEDVDKICDKYNLVFADVSRYTGFVPSKNLKEIESFRGLKNGDYLHKTKYLVEATLRFESLDEEWAPIIKQLIKSKIPYSFGLSGRDILGIFGKDIDNKYRTGPSLDSATFVEIPGSESLLICAPKKDMDTKGLKRNKFGFLKLKSETYPDPVVLKPIIGGYLILTAWGDESSDELVVNHKFN